MKKIVSMFMALAMTASMAATTFGASIDIGDSDDEVTTEAAANKRCYRCGGMITISAL